MFITRGIDTVILHMPKCGGSSVRWSVLKKYPDYRWSCEHADIRAIPYKFKNFRRIGFCRNPITWYASKYYHASRLKQDALSHVVVLSDNLTLAFDETLPRLLDLRNFLDMHPQYLENLKQRLTRLAMNRYLGRIILSYPDISEIKAEDFGHSLYDHWYRIVGLDTAVVYKMDDGRFGEYVDKEFPGTQLHLQNVGTKLNLEYEYSQNMLNNIYSADRQYFDKHEYSKDMKTWPA